MYDPALGRFTQIDPIDKEDLSPYAWVTNNPLLYADPLGLDSVRYNDLPNTPIDPENDVVILPEVVVKDTYTGPKAEDSYIVQQAANYILTEEDRQNRQLATGSIEPFYFVPNPIETAISVGDNLRRGEFLVAAIGALAIIPGGKTIRGTLTAVGLPVLGKIRFIPPKTWNPSMGMSALKKNGGFVDKFGNIWQKKKVVGKSAGEIHWDVQLSSTGKEQLGHLSNSGNHLNVTPRGEIAH